jgi:DNA replication protein DnaC
MPFINTLSKRNQKEFLKNFKLDLSLEKSYFFCGIPGSGKTSKSLFFAKKWLEKNKIEKHEENQNVKFVRFGDLIELSKETFQDGQKGSNAREEIREIKNCRFLILDDLGTEKNTEYVDKIIYDFINYRFEEELQTLFTSNYTLENISKNYHDRIASRITELCGKTGIISFEDVDYRQFSEGFEHSENKLSPSETEEPATKFSLEGKTQEEIDNYNIGRAYFLSNQTPILKKI